MFLMPEDTPRGSGGRSNNCISYNKKYHCNCCERNRKIHFNLKCSTGSCTKTPITCSQKKSEITFLLQKGGGEKKKCESYEVEIKTN